MLIKVVYHVNRRFPVLTAPVRSVAGAVARLLHREGIKRALNEATLQETIGSTDVTLRPLRSSDADWLFEFFIDQPANRFDFFQPHGFSRAELHSHLKNSQFISYGLFEDSRLIGYALIRLTPTRAAYVGSMVAKSHEGRGVGKMLASYLYWQIRLMDLDAFLTISGENIASLRSHSPDRILVKIEDLNSDGYALYRAPRVQADLLPPSIQFRDISSLEGRANDQ